MEDSSEEDKLIEDTPNNVDLASQKQRKPYVQHFSASVEMFGDKTTLTQLVVLLAYIRSYIKSKTPGEILLSIGKTMNSTDAFTFTVNGEEIPDMLAAKELEIN